MIGHQRPDTDSAVSASVYAELLTDLAGGREQFEGVVLGPLSPQATWLFETSGKTPPRQIPDLHPRVSELAAREVFSVGPEAALGGALRLITQHHISLVPVLSADHRLIGILSDRSSMAHYFYHFNAEDFLGTLFSLDDLARHLPLSPWQPATRPAEGRVTLEWTALEPGSVLLHADDPECVPRAAAAGAAAVIVSARKLTPKWKRAIQAHPQIGVYAYPGSLMALISEFSLAIPVTRLMSEEFPRLTPDQTLREAEAALRENRFALPVVNPDGTLFGVVSRADLLNAPRRRVVLVDHFEQHQAPEGLGNAHLVEIVDHHRVGTLETRTPIRVDCRPVGSTATIIACKFDENRRRPSSAQARLLLGAVIADTLLLTSPTTTDVDRRQAAQLARRARVPLQEFGRDVLALNDETQTRSPEELVEKDLKEFVSEGLRFAVAQIETVDRTRITEPQLRALSLALRKRRLSAGWSLAALMLTDIFRGDSLILVDAESRALHRGAVNGNSLEPEVWAGCVSRKKQFLPVLLERLRLAKST
ncbi:MAG: CBS domain-containing protein [Verrucomicrobia bacterium]|nr:CBS domain-containing protein [Verrucomicrobiota bacterium]